MQTGTASPRYELLVYLAMRETTPSCTQAEEKTALGYVSAICWYSHARANTHKRSAAHRLPSSSRPAPPVLSRKRY